jgi:hypothetical protein
MLFYVSLFIACVMSALVVLYIYHALADAGKAVYRALLPSSKNNITRDRRNVRFNSAISDTPTPWGWNGNNHEAREYGTKPATTNGASGLDGFRNKHNNESSSVGWPHREDKVELAGTAYKVTRKTASKKSRPETNSKQPWGW